ncbi:MAG: PilZ domain-containing protein [Thermoleophilia bacterium]|nr:PilZ domain-containing protein [Thermoleophilia bacterium]
MVDIPCMGNRRLAELAGEFTALNRRRVEGDPPLSVLDLERWSELRDLLSFEFGHTPPVGPDKHPRHLRVPTHLKVRYEADGEHAAALINLSEGGLFVACIDPLPPGTPLRLEIEGEMTPAPLRLEAEVIHARNAGNPDGPSGFGVEFRNLEVEQHEQLRAFIDNSLSAVAD